MYWSPVWRLRKTWDANAASATAHGRSISTPCCRAKRGMGDAPDLLLHGQEVIEEGSLTVPHSRLHERSFVLGPLAEIAPALRHPVLKRSMVELLAGLGHRPLQGRRALITGSSSGIGRAIALA